jgi:RNA polymerase sigma-70 factor (ECF subfamily)
MSVSDILDKSSAHDTSLAGDGALHSVEDVYRSHSEFIWVSLQRFGVRERDLDDVLQEVFVVVHQRLKSFRGEARVTTWLYSICLRVAAAHRRRGHVRRELTVEDVGDTVAIDQSSPEDDLVRRQRQRVLEQILDDLELEKRALFVMFELDELSCDEIATIIGVPIGTVYSRLHAARKAFDKATQRYHLRTRRGAR